MFKTTSKTGVGVAALVIMMVLELLGVEGITESMIATHIVSTIEVVSFILVIVGQLTRGDLVGGLFRKEV